jgi:hypothetical protein
MFNPEAFPQEGGQNEAKEERSPAAQLIEAREKLKKAQEEWDKFRVFADDVQKKAGKLIQKFDENDPKEKEFIDYWDSEESRYRNESEKWGGEIKKLEDIISPLGNYQAGIAIRARENDIKKAIDEEMERSGEGGRE